MQGIVTGVKLVSGQPVARVVLHSSHEFVTVPVLALQQSPDSEDPALPNSEDDPTACLPAQAPSAARPPATDSEDTPSTPEPRLTRSRACLALQQQEAEASRKRVSRRRLSPAADAVEAPSTPEPRVTRSKGLPCLPQLASPPARCKTPAAASPKAVTKASTPPHRAADPAPAPASAEAPSTPSPRPAASLITGAAPQPEKQSSDASPPRSMRASTAKQRRLAEDRRRKRPRQQQDTSGQRRYGSEGSLSACCLLQLSSRPAPSSEAGG